MSETIPFFDLADELLAEAKQAHSGRASRTVFGGRDRVMRQTLIALAAEADLAEHEPPTEATLLVIRGAIPVRASGEAWPLQGGEHIEIPRTRHSVHARDDSVFLLTVVPG